MGMTTTQHTEMEMRGLTEDLVKKILSDVPLKPLSRMKCVAKSWKQMISTMTRTGLVLQQEVIQDKMETSLKLTLLTAEEHGEQGCITLEMFSFSVDDVGAFFLSSNGLLLCEVDGRFYVGNSIHDHWAALAEIDLSMENSSLGFAFNGFDHFRVVVIFWENVPYSSDMPFAVFSSKTNQWTEHNVKVLNIDPLLAIPQGVRYSPYCTSYFINGAIHWIWNSCMLVFTAKESFILIKLPINAINCSHSKDMIESSNCLCDFGYEKCLWESKGRLHYCRSEKQGFPIWEYTGGDYDDNKNPNDMVSNWELKTVVVLDPLIARYPDIFVPIKETLPLWKVAQLCSPCAFIEDLQLLVVRLPWSIVSYNFENQRLTQVWSFGEKRLSSYKCNIQPFVPISTKLVDVLSFDFKQVKLFDELQS